MGEIKEGLIKSESHGSIHFPFVPSAALVRCIEGANGNYSPRTDLIRPSLIHSVQCVTSFDKVRAGLLHPRTSPFGLSFVKYLLFPHLGDAGSGDSFYHAADFAFHSFVWTRLFMVGNNTTN
jgi:hypothetical protein